MRYILGPELFWLLLYGVTRLLVHVNIPPSESMDNFIRSCWFYVPMLALLSFGFYWLPVEKSWLILRIWMAGLVGGLLVMGKVMSAYRKQGPGIGTAYIIGVLFLFVVLIIGTVIINFKS